MSTFQKKRYTTLDWPLRPTGILTTKKSFILKLQHSPADVGIHLHGNTLCLSFENVDERRMMNRARLATSRQHLTHQFNNVPSYACAFKCK